MIRSLLRYLLAVLYALAGYFHLATPGFFLPIMPLFVPAHEAVVFWTGVAEIAGAVALAQPFSARLRRAGGIGLALYALCVWPANVNHMLIDLARADGGAGGAGGWGMAYHAPRMLLQPVLIWLALWTAGVTRWPLRKAGGRKLS